MDWREQALEMLMEYAEFVNRNVEPELYNEYFEPNIMLMLEALETIV